MTVAVREPAATRSAEHRFFSTMSVVAAVVVLTGFANTYPAKVLSADAAVPAVVHLHAAVFTSWLILFVVQTLLVMRGNIKLHQQLGTAGIALAGVMLIVGALTARTVAQLGHRGIPGVEFPDAEGFLLLNLTAAVVFAGLAGAAWLYRRRP